MKKYVQWAAGNAGALTVLQLLTNPMNLDLGSKILDKLEQYSTIRGTNLYVFWSDLCDKNLNKMSQLINNCPQEILEDACNRQDYSGRELVKEFFKEAKPKHDFYTEEFYANPELTLDILNKLVNEKHVADKDMYQSGEFLFMEVFENAQTIDILSKVINNIEKYKAHNNSQYVSDEITEIGLCALQDDHAKHFGNKDAIMWDHENESFEFAGTLSSEDDEYCGKP